MKLLIMGRPGAGKGTQAVNIREYYNIPHISTGDMFRAAIKNQTKLGLEAKSYMDKGALVPDEVTIGIVEERLLAEDCKDGFLLDGFPRTIAQAEALDAFLKKNGIKLDAVLDVNVPQEILVRRMVGRRVCKNCGATFHVEFNAPKVEDMCDDCNVPLTTRNDDNEETFKIGFAAYEKNCAPVIEYYRNKGMLIELDASKDPEYTFEQLEKIIGSKND